MTIWLMKAIGGRLEGMLLGKYPVPTEQSEVKARNDDVYSRTLCPSSVDPPNCPGVTPPLKIKGVGIDEWF